MKKTIVQPVSSQLYSFGSSEVIYDDPLQIDNISSFCTQFDHQQLRGGFSNIPSQCQTAGLNTNQELEFSYAGEGYLTTTSTNYDCFINPDQHPFSLSSSTPNYEFPETENPRKRRTEINANIREVNKPKKNKKMNKTSMDSDDHHQWISREQVPIKRSQKLSDKITILQKLVSPYGKTDTASVLEEAFVSIKFLQDQIQNLCETETETETETTSESELDLRSRGLCLVPVSFYSGRVSDSL